MAAGKIVVLGTGGTIAGVGAGAGSGVQGHLGYQSAQLGVEQLVAGIPGLQSVSLITEQVAQVDSKDMAPGIWQALAARCAHWLQQPQTQGLVITHGTDTLEETAYFLHRVLAPAKPVVITCAMRPATALAPDGPQNLLDAITVVASPGARGVLAVCAGRVHGARDVAKVHPYRLDAFDSGEAGPLAVVEEGHLRPLRPWPESEGVPPGLAQAVAATAPSSWPRVEIVLNHAGADGLVVDALVAQGVAGLVAAGTGNGTLSEGLTRALLQAQAQGVRVVRSTRCALGQVVPHGSDALPEASGLSPVKARVELQLRLLAARA